MADSIARMGNDARQELAERQRRALAADAFYDAVREFYRVSGSVGEAAMAKQYEDDDPNEPEFILGERANRERGRQKKIHCYAMARMMYCFVWHTLLENGKGVLPSRKRAACAAKDFAYDAADEYDYDMAKDIGQQVVIDMEAELGIRDEDLYNDDDGWLHQRNPYC